MQAPEEITDSPTGWVAKHIHNYVETDGAKGHEFHGVPALLLTTRGRKSGLLRRTALYYGEDGGNYVLVASQGGRPEHPLWYLNLVADPQVQVQVQAEKFPARARTVTDSAEKARLWELMNKIYPEYDTYQRKTTRDIPVVVLEPQRG